MMPSFVLDCSVTMAWCFADERTSAAAALQDRLTTEAAVVPAHWFLEVGNVLIMAEKHKRIVAPDAAQFLALLRILDIRADHETAPRTFDHLLPLCRAHHLTTYDAAYLDLAMRLQLPLATLDKDLRKAAKKLQVDLLG